MTTYHISYRIGSTELHMCCLDIDEAYDAVKDIRDHDPEIWRACGMTEIMSVLVDMKRDVATLFKSREKLRICVRKDDGDAQRD